MERVIKLTETDLRRMIMESVDEVSGYWDPEWDHLAQDLENDYKQRHPEGESNSEDTSNTGGQSILDELLNMWKNLSPDKKNILIRIVLAYITKGRFRR